jgi:hypothetical protein
MKIDFQKIITFSGFDPAPNFFQHFAYYTTVYNVIMYQGRSYNSGRAAEPQTWPILTDRPKDRESADSGLGKTSRKQKPEKVLEIPLVRFKILIGSIENSNKKKENVLDNQNPGHQS